MIGKTFFKRIFSGSPPLILLLWLVFGCRLFDDPDRERWRAACFSPDNSRVGVVAKEGNDLIGVLIDLETGAVVRRTARLGNIKDASFQTMVCFPDGEIAVDVDKKLTWLTSDFVAHRDDAIIGAVSADTLAVGGLYSPMFNSKPEHRPRAASRVGLAKIGEEISKDEPIALTSDLFVENADSIVGAADENAAFKPLVEIYPIVNGRLLLASTFAAKRGAEQPRWGVFAVDLAARRVSQIGATKVITDEMADAEWKFYNSRMTVSGNEKVVAGFIGAENAQLFAFRINEERPFFSQPFAGASSVMLNANGRLLAVVSQPRSSSGTGKITVFDTETNEKLFETAIKETVIAGRFSPQADVFSAATANRTIIKIDGRTGEVLSEKDYGATDSE